MYVPSSQPLPRTMPAVFAAQGMPMLLDHPGWVKAFRAWGAYLGRPKAILVVSAHWEWTGTVVIGSTTDTVPLYYDFGGFPQHFYELAWPAPGSPAVAERVVELVDGWMPTGHEPARGLDHGAFVPLMLMFPAHDIPTVQIAQPSLDPVTLFELGKRLAPLRREGVLIFTTGLLTHRAAGVAENGPPTAPFVHFDQWVANALGDRDLSALLDYESCAPQVDAVMPTREHFTPLFVALGAGGLDQAPRFPTTGFWYGNSMRSFELNGHARESGVATLRTMAVATAPLVRSA